MVKFIVIAFVLFLLSCHSDVPSLPDFSEVKYCKYETKKGTVCKSVYEVSKEECDFAKGEIVDSCE
jgi:hypothetical protein